MKNQILKLLAAFLFLGVTATANLHAQSASVFATELKSPAKIILTPRANLLVAGADAGKNAGQVSIVDRNGGAHRTLLSGLPSGTDLEGGLSGTTGLLLDNRRNDNRANDFFGRVSRDPAEASESLSAIPKKSRVGRGRVLFVLNGIGDTVRRGTQPGTEVPNPEGPASPILSSVLRVVFDAHVDDLTSGFTLTLADHFRLADGFPVTLENTEAQHATVELVTDFRDIVPDARTIVRGANPYGLAQMGNTLYVPDAGYNTVVKVNAETGRTQTLARFAPIPNPLFPSLGGPMIDPVPDSIRLVGDQLLVTFLTGFPFPAGASRVQLVNLATGANTPFITDLTAAIDVLFVERRRDFDAFYVLEFSSNLLQGMPGRLLRVDALTGSRSVVAENLITPSSMTYDRQTGDLFVTEIGTGRIIRVQIP